MTPSAFYDLTDEDKALMTAYKRTRIKMESVNSATVGKKTPVLPEGVSIKETDD